MRIKRSLLGPIVILSFLGLNGCASAVPRPVETSAVLGKVVVYRNGVAYFERYARLNGDQLRLRVPGERLDDLLKSLTVVDARSGQPVPVSFPTLEHVGDQADVVVQLSKPAPTELRISYVTESPAWKPSYRLKFSRNGRAQLEAWAVVDNVSGEDWKRVAVGVGSTSALSFRYDLHSVRYVQRETLTDGALLGAAPPPGGSPYSVGGKELQMLAGIAPEELEPLGDSGASAEISHRGASSAAGRSYGGGAGAQPAASPPHPSRKSLRPQQQTIDDSLLGIARRAQENKEKLRIEGYAQASDGDRDEASLRRANLVRNKLLANGVPADQIEVIATGRLGGPDSVRVLSLPPDNKPSQAIANDGSSEEPIGESYFLSKTPLTIQKGDSALVSLLSAEVSAEQVYYYDPVSERGSKKFAFRTVLLKNPTAHTLDAGPFTVYANDQFLGEGLGDAIPANSRAFIPYALDRQLLVETEESGNEAIDRLLTIQRGIVRAEARSVKTTKFVLYNRGTQPALTYVRHALSPGYKLESPATDFEKLRDAYLFPISVAAGASTTLTITESTPFQKTMDVRSASGVGELALYLKASKHLPQEFQQKLDLIVQMHRALAELDERLRTVATQTQMYRDRIEELNLQLVTLRRVTQAQELSRQLARKMEELSSRLQKATLESVEIEGKRLTQRVALEDKLAELTLDAGASTHALANTSG